MLSKDGREVGLGGEERAWVGIKSVVVVCNEWLKTKRSSKGLLAARQRLQEVKESKRGKRRRGKAGGDKDFL